MLKLGNTQLNKAYFGNAEIKKAYFGTSLVLDALFSPLQLFANGEQGAWYDPSDLSSLFQDSAGTTAVTTDGDPVGYMGDKSGNGNHATQSVSGSRPVYRTDGVLHWLEGNGVNSALNTTALFNLTDKWAVSWAGEWAGFYNYGAPWRMLSEGGRPTSTTTNRLEEYGRSDRDRVLYSRYQVQGSSSNRSMVYPSTGIPLVAWANRNVGIESAVGEIYNGSPTQKVNSGLPFSVGTATLSIFRGYRGDEMEGKIHGFVFVVDGLSVEKRADLNTYMQEKSGVTL